MSKKSFTGPKGVKWNLSDLYKSINDPKINKNLKLISLKADKFEKKYRNRIKSPKIKADELLSAIKELESISEKCAKILSYANLLFAADTSDPKIGAFMQSTQEKIILIRKKLLFFDVELISLSNKKANDLINDPKLNKYKHFLERERIYKTHTLSEAEEKIMAEKSNTSSKAFSRLFDEVINNIEFDVRVNGQKQKLNESKTLALLYDSNRKTRIAASKGLTKGLIDNSHVLTYIFNTLVNDHQINDRIRSYDNPMSARNLSNEISDQTVDSLLISCENNFHMVEKYYKLKKKILGLPKLYDYDRYAPLYHGAKKISYIEAKKIVIESFNAFSPKMSSLANLFFKNNWIDAEIRDGKRGGAFSHGTVPSVHPYVFINYTGYLRDVMTLAHELGHGVHQYLSRKQGYFQCYTPLTTAETASVFAEMIVFNNLMKSGLNKKQKLALLCGKLEEIFATVFRQAILTKFEQKLHHERRNKGELTTEQINNIWTDTNKDMYGNSVNLTKNYGYWWLYIPHFIHSPFYCYAYSFGELLVFALYNLYKREGRSFVPKYIKLLSAGGSDSPDKLLEGVGVNINDPNFWQGGLDLIGNMVEDATSLAN